MKLEFKILKLMIFLTTRTNPWGLVTLKYFILHYFTKHQKFQFVIMTRAKKLNL